MRHDMATANPGPDDLAHNARSQIMRAVKAKNTSPELAVRQMVWHLGFRYRLHRADLPGKPDLVFPGARKVIFVNGCFWHGHDCRRGARMPKSNSEYWKRKIDGNRSRDFVNATKLTDLGWEARTVWECELRDPELLEEKLRQYLGVRQCISGELSDGKCT